VPLTLPLIIITTQANLASILSRGRAADHAVANAQAQVDEDGNAVVSWGDRRRTKRH